MMSDDYCRAILHQVAQRFMTAASVLDLRRKSPRRESKYRELRISALAMATALAGRPKAGSPRRQPVCRLLSKRSMNSDAFASPQLA